MLKKYKTSSREWLESVNTSNRHTLSEEVFLRALSKAVRSESLYRLYIRSRPVRLAFPEHTCVVCLPKNQHKQARLAGAALHFLEEAHLALGCGVERAWLSSSLCFRGCACRYRVYSIGGFWDQASEVMHTGPKVPDSSDLPAVAPSCSVFMWCHCSFCTQQTGNLSNMYVYVHTCMPEHTCACSCV